MFLWNWKITIRWDVKQCPSPRAEIKAWLSLTLRVCFFARLARSSTQIARKKSMRMLLKVNFVFLSEWWSLMSVFFLLLLLCAMTERKIASRTCFSPFDLLFFFFTLRGAPRKDQQMLSWVSKISMIKRASIYFRFVISFEPSRVNTSLETRTASVIKWDQMSVRSVNSIANCDEISRFKLTRKAIKRAEIVKSHQPR